MKWTSVLLKRGAVLGALVVGLLTLPWLAAQGTAESSEGSGAQRPTAARLAMGATHTCVINPAGAVYCWGSNNRGALGSGDGASLVGDNETPAAAGSVKLGAGRKALAIAAGSNHTCVLLDDGSVKCWGRNDLGQLGLGNSNDIGDNETPGSVAPVDLGVGRTAIAITAGGHHSCAVLDDRSVRCWGDNSLGQLGLGNTVIIGDDETPGTVPVVAVGGPVEALSAGAGHTCAIIVGGTLRCWGYAANGQLGLGVLPAVSTGGGGGNSGGNNSGGGNSGTVPDLTPPGAIDCVDRPFDPEAPCQPDDGGGSAGGGGGSGTGGTIAIGDDESPATSPVVFLGDGLTATAVSAGSFHTCAVLSDGSVRCWGLNRTGATGQANQQTIGDDESPGDVEPVILGTGRTGVTVSAGYAHSCAVLDNAAVRCWGSNDAGQLGAGNTNAIGDDEAPTAIPAVAVGDGRSALTVSTGGGRRIPAGTTTPQAAGHTCAILDNETLRCWGANESGQLGLANSADLGDNESVLTAANVAVPGMLGAGQGLGSTGRFTSQVPQRLVDTRLALGPRQAGALGPNRTLKFMATDPSSNAVAVALNVTVVSPSGDSVVALGPSGEAEPFVANLNTPAGKVVGNLVIVKVGADGAVNLYNSPTTTHIVIDKLGEYRVGDGAQFASMAPQRLTDTRTANEPIGPGGVRSLKVAGVAGIPATATSVVLNVVATDSTEGGFLTVYPKSAGLPIASSINFERGTTTGNLVIASVGVDGSIDIFNRFGATHVVIDALGWFGPDASEGALTAVTPTRLTDTRLRGVAGGQYTIVRETRAGVAGDTCKVIARVAGVAPVPGNATSVVLNLAVVNPLGAGYLNVSKDGANPTATANLNFAGRTVANAVITQVAADGTVVVTNPHGCADLVIDVSGYFGGSAPLS